MPLTPRPALVDAHHHLLNLEAVEYPWIRQRSPVLEALLENYYDIACDYSVPDYLSDVSGERLVKSVACEFGAADAVAEAEWVQREADDHGFPHAFIAGVDLTSPTLADVLARYRDMPVVRAVRQPLYWADDPLKRLGPRPDLVTDPAWLRGFELVAAHGFTWDLLLYDEQLPAAHELLRSFPDTRFVLEAAGWPLDLSEDGFRRWEERLQAVSEHPNVTVKAQGLALLFGPSAERIRPWVRSVVRIFGPRRCMFAGHFPVDRLLWSFGELVDALLAVLDELSADARADVFSGCAVEQYGLA
ncbi:putative TIM-barrel fold metal-dependent hydrolase [Saccharomonospora cyanea NA-134]|uniref:Putative TIM-barrel fold metal-dependent hydrolase n=2 Tax=Saccharomonospora cyanea TaxID=40989 RepID=H5XNJ9_9PSEU|nr:putative TIM-barrel fold metal-dependent hydrolase [Saccharomonospora cyanea NA-134]